MANPPGEISLELLFRMFDLDAEPDEYGVQVLIHLARRASVRLPNLVLSLADGAGLRLGSGSADELARTRARRADYAELLTEVAELPVRVLKGTALARYYPEDVLRPVGDIDVTVPDERTLWDVARRVLAKRPAEFVLYSQFGVAEQHTVISIQWPSADPLFDGHDAFEVSTAALLGELERGVAPRTELPSCPWTADLLAVAEERQQRPFTPKDAVDVVALASAELPDMGAVATTVAECRRSPEVVELLEYTGQWVTLGLLAELLERLREDAVADSTHRSSIATSVHAADTCTIEGRRAVGLPIYGMPLREVAGRAHWREARRHRFAGGELALTPVGDYLMVPSKAVDTDLHAAAVRELAVLDDEQDVISAAATR